MTKEVIFAIATVLITAITPVFIIAVLISGFVLLRYLTDLQRCKKVGDRPVFRERLGLLFAYVLLITLIYCSEYVLMHDILAGKDMLIFEFLGAKSVSGAIILIEIGKMLDNYKMMHNESLTDYLKRRFDGLFSFLHSAKKNIKDLWSK